MMSSRARILAITGATVLIAGGGLVAWLTLGSGGHGPARVVQVALPSLGAAPATPDPLRVKPKRQPFSTTAPKGTGLGAPDHFTGKAGQTMVSLHWRPVATAAGYVVYRDGKSIGETTGTSFDDTRLPPGTPHVWTVTAVDAHNTQGDPSSPLSLTPR
ncbi:MAG TPA: hypothetical protein VNW94_27670 [Streptosporangiaceae bacterium]|nr:hypothetical protein [Streptosporangiaceae bacterium]